MSIGSDLKSARESKRISLETVSKRTKIAVKYLEALEEDRYDIFPSHTYAKGFIRAYAKVVGLDQTLLTRQFNTQAQPEDVRIEPMNAEAELEKNLGWRPTLHRPQVFKQPEENADLNLEMVEEEPSRHEAALVRQRASALRRRKWGRWASSAAAGLFILGLAIIVVFYAAKLLSNIKWGGPKTDTTASDTTGYQPVSIADKYQHLVLKGLDKSWVLVTIDDGQSSSSIDLDQGETKTYKALKNFKVRLGNAGGVQIQYNGKLIPLLGTAGQVVEIQLPPGSGGNDVVQETDDNS